MDQLRALEVVMDLEKFEKFAFEYGDYLVRDMTWKDTGYDYYDLPEDPISVFSTEIINTLDPLLIPAIRGLAQEYAEQVINGDKNRPGLEYLAYIEEVKDAVGRANYEDCVAKWLAGGKPGRYVAWRLRPKGHNADGEPVFSWWRYDSGERPYSYRDELDEELLPEKPSCWLRFNKALSAARQIARSSHDFPAVTGYISEDDAQDAVALKYLTVAEFAAAIKVPVYYVYPGAKTGEDWFDHSDWLDNKHKEHAPIAMQNDPHQVGDEHTYRGYIYYRWDEDYYLGLKAVSSYDPIQF